MRRFRLLGFCALGALALTLAGGADGGAPGQGFDSTINPQGRPTAFKEGKRTAYAVWHSKQGWRLRTTTRAREHHFTGTVTVEGGTFKKIHSHHLEKTGELADHWKVGPKRHTVRFDFKTDKGLDGINFTVTASAKAIRFNLRIDGKHERERILIGAGNHHPNNDPFLLRAHPGGKIKKGKTGF
jgi:hypothetical protein